MKRLLLILVLLIVFAGTAKAGTYDHSVQISTGQTVIDSVIAYIEVDNTKLDSAKWFVFPVDSFVTIPDTAALIIEYRFYYKIDSAAGTFRMTSQLLAAVSKTESVYDNVVGFYVVDTISGDSLSSVSVTLKDAGGSPQDVLITNSDGFNKANLVTGNWTFIATRSGDSFRDTTINITTDDTILVRGGLGSIGAPAGGNEVRIFGFAFDVIDTADAMQNVWAVIELVSVANNTCDSTITVPRQKMKLTDAAGQFTFDVVRSSCLSDTDYRIWLTWEGGKSSIHIFTAPDQSSFKLLW